MRLAIDEARLARLAVAAGAGLWVSMIVLAVSPSYPFSLTGRPVGLLEMPAFTTMLVAGPATATVTYLVTRRRRALELVVGILLVVAIWGVVAAVWPSINPFPSSAPDIRNPVLD